MLDVAMLDALALLPGNRCLSGDEVRRLPRLDQVFDRVVADGWAPRSPAFEPELSQLEARVIRGTCLTPILRPSDTIYVDHRTPPAAGDIVTFRISKRLADLQQGYGERVYLAGNTWGKLFLPYFGIDFLLENAGNSMTSTLACCELPTETPVLQTVRNVRRQGKLLFTPDEAYCINLATNAATTLTIGSQANWPVTAGSGITTIFSLTPPTSPVASTCIVTVSLNCTWTAGLSLVCWASVGGSVKATSPDFAHIAGPVSAATFQGSFSMAANTSISIDIQAVSSGGGAGTFSNVLAPVEVLKR